jgi:hypothetical protein
MGQDLKKKRACEKRSLLFDFFSTPEPSDRNTLQGEGSPDPGQEEFQGADNQLSEKDLSPVEESTLERVTFFTHIEEISFERFLKSRLKKIDSRLSREVK